MDKMDDLPEEMTLAIEIIRQLENLSFEPDIVLQAMSIVCKDTLSKMGVTEEQRWRAWLKAELSHQS